MVLLCRGYDVMIVTKTRTELGTDIGDRISFLCFLLLLLILRD